MPAKKGIYSSQCVWTSLEIDFGWAERQRSRDKSAWKGQVPHEHHYPSAGPSVKQASPCEGAKPEGLVPASQGLELRYRNSGK